MIIALGAAPLIAAADSGNGFSNWVTIVTTILVSIGGGGGFFQLLKVRADKRAVHAGTEKARAEAADILSDAAVGLLVPFREELDRMRVRVFQLEETLVRERSTADTRIRQLELDIAARDQEIFQLRLGRNEE